MKLLLLALTLTLPACSVNWKLLGKEAGQAALDASAPIVLKHITTPAKQPVNVQP